MGWFGKRLQTREETQDVLEKDDMWSAEGRIDGSIDWPKLFTSWGVGEGRSVGRVDIELQHDISLLVL